MHQFPYAFKLLLIRGSFCFNLPSHNLEDLTEVMDDRERWQERLKEFCTDVAT